MAQVREVTLLVYRGNAQEGHLQEFRIPAEEGMVVLDAIHYIQAHHAPDLAVRWNCKAGKCGSCGAEVNGLPRLMCMTRLDELDLSRPVVVRPMRTFPVLKDLVCDVSLNFRMNEQIPPLTPREDADWRMSQEDVDRVQEFRKCIECFLCQDVCHVLRDHRRPDFLGPRYFVRLAGLEMHPMDALRRTRFLKEVAGIGYCNITKCCTEVCPEEIHITDNAIIPLKERVVDDFYDPLRVLLNRFRRRRERVV